jgi:ribosomal protein L21E
MEQFTQGDRVRVDIPDESDIDYEQFHGQHGRIISILKDDAGTVTGGEQDSQLYRVEFDSGETMDFRRHDLRPPIE